MIDLSWVSKGTWCLIVFANVCMHISVWIFCNPIDCSPPGSSLHGVFQARIIEWVTISFSRIFPGRLSRRLWRWGFDFWVGNIPWRRKWQPTPVLANIMDNIKEKMAVFLEMLLREITQNSLRSILWGHNSGLNALQTTVRSYQILILILVFLWQWQVTAIRKLQSPYCLFSL